MSGERGRMEGKVGLIFLPMIFGISRSFLKHVFDAAGKGFRVVYVDPYQGQHFLQRSFRSLIKGDEKGNIAVLAEKFNDDRVMAGVVDASLQLENWGCEKIFLMGFGMGAVWALQYAELMASSSSINSRHIDGVVGWYPHLIFPPGATKKPPNLDQTKCPITLFFGRRDTKIEPGTIELAKEVAARSNGRIEVVLFERVGHAFADSFVQNNFPNLLWLNNLFAHMRAARESQELALRWVNHWVSPKIRL